MFTLEYAKNPTWNDAEGNSICLIVKWEEFVEEMPFNATNYDSMPYGVDLYNRAKAGEFGEIGEFIPFVPSTSIPITEITNTTVNQVSE
jgi:hypothetical protein